MKIMHLVSVAIIGTAAFLLAPGGTPPALALTPSLQGFIGGRPAQFDTPEAAVAAFKEALAKGDLAAMATLLGLDAKKLRTADGISDRMVEMRDAAAKLVSVSSDGDKRIVSLGTEVWPFPFPLVKNTRDGKWAFDTQAGVQEIANRRVGENELEAIKTARLYVEAQRDYASEDHDGDGVLEYARKLISSPGKTDGLYWPAEQGDGDSPVGPNIDPGALDKAEAGKGYFGYRFRILERQGSNIAGGSYGYVINGHMIAGFGLIAWPVEYGRTGIATFMINQSGVLYEKDLGPRTAEIASKIHSFNPGSSWRVVPE
ncbi:DUF2950 domain-containing protein [Aestuariivirga sp.]|uniref:DUF2950 domain-containing protein n=1 Tax=Aestuariivirga sp. TaxID=2650926 RepID=UPI0035B00F65